MKPCCKWISIACCAALLNFASAYAQIPSSVMTLRSISRAMTLNYRLFTPSGYDHTKKYPLILAFHGVSQDGTDESNTGYVDYNSLCLYWVSNTLQAAHPCFVVAPHNPSGTWIDTNYTACNTTGTYRQGPISTRLSTVMGILDSLQKEFSIDTNRLYVTGLSVGGFATWDLITRYPGKFAAAIPMSGAADTSKAPAAAQVPVWCCHGQIDNTVTPVSERYMMAAIDRLDGSKGVAYPECNGITCVTTFRTKLDSLVNAGIIHFYWERQNIGHAIWDTCYANTSLQAWLFKQVKNGASAVSGIRSGSPAVSCSGNARIVLADRSAIQSLLHRGGRVYDLRGSLVRNAGFKQGSAAGRCLLMVSP
jgi:predicted peptidase